MNTEKLLKEIVAKSSPKKMTTDELEKYIEKRYSEHAPQSELNRLETEYARRVTEEDLHMTEDDLTMSEGIALEEQLVEMYHKYLTPSARQGMTEENIIENMRSAVESYGGRNLADKQILDAAKDVYKIKKKIYN